MKAKDAEDCDLEARAAFVLLFEQSALWNEGTGVVHSVGGADKRPFVRSCLWFVFLFLSRRGFSSKNPDANFLKFSVGSRTASSHYRCFTIHIGGTALGTPTY